VNYRYICISTLEVASKKFNIVWLNVMMAILDAYNVLVISCGVYACKCYVTAHGTLKSACSEHGRFLVLPRLVAIPNDPISACLSLSVYSYV
jgi:hypothetical protein